MMNPPGKRQYEFTELLGIVLAMFQERIGIIIGGLLIAQLAPMLFIIPPIIVTMVTIGFAAFTSNADISQDFGKLIPVIVTGLICAIGAILTATFLQMGWMKICLNITKGEEANFSEFTSNTQYAGSFILTSLALIAIVIAGSFFLIVPGIFLAIKFAFAPYLVLDQNKSPIEALQESWSLTQGYSLSIFLAGVAFLVVSTISSFIPLVNLVAPLLVHAFFSLIVTSIYRSMKGDLAAST